MALLLKRKERKIINISSDYKMKLRDMYLSSSSLAVVTSMLLRFFQTSFGHKCMILSWKPPTLAEDQGYKGSSWF